MYFILLPSELTFSFYSKNSKINLEINALFKQNSNILEKLFQQFSTTSFLSQQINVLDFTCHYV